MDVNPKQIMRTMSVSQRQMVEIAKAVSYDAKIIVLDEPTSSLTEREIKKLFTIINDLRKKGISFVYISHKMDELFEICDDISVMRDGKMIMIKPIKETTMNEIVSAMVGRSLDKRFPDVDNTPGEEVLKVENLSTLYPPYLKDISFSVRRGEILGFYGLVGAGRSELLESLFGLRGLSSGTITYLGKKVRFHSSRDAMDYNFALVTEERKKDGIFQTASLVFNTCISNLDKYKLNGVLSDQLMKDSSEKELRNMHTKYMNSEDTILSLSGGNQQKVLLAKWMFADPEILILDEPTRGIDVGAKYEIYCIINQLVAEGKSVIMISSELPEILGMCDRIYVMNEGKMVGELDAKDATQEKIMTYILQSSGNEEENHE
jgi:methyl-galactoside transport system ATP-binding protein